MKKTLPFLSLAFLIFLFATCSKKNTGSVDTATPIEKPIVRVSKSTITADGFEESRITVVDKNGNDVTAQAAVTVNGIQISNLNYATNVVGISNIRAMVNGGESLAVTITSTTPVSRHTQKVLVEDYTGAWCGHCPRVGKPLDDLNTANSNIIPVAVHNADAFTYSLESQMRSRYSVTGFPTAVVNRNFKWNENTSAIINETTKWAPLGLAIESSIAGTTISGKVKTQFNFSSNSVPLKVVVMLLEDGKVSPQTNYGYFGLPNPISNYVHNHILRVASTNIFGDNIAQSEVVKDNILETNFTFNASSYVLSNCNIVAFVTYADGIAGRVGLLNLQKVKAGQTKAFD